MAKNTGKRLKGDAENFYKRDICHIHMFSFVLTKWILLAARQTAVATCRRSDRKPVGLPFRLQTENILLLPLIPTQRILLSTSRRLVPLSLQRGKYVISFYFPLFKQSGINYPPTSSVPLSFKKGASFLMLSFS